MIRRTILAVALGLLCTGFGAAARAEVRSWDSEKVKTLAEQLHVAANELYDAFYKQPILGVAQNKVYYRLKQDTRRLRAESAQLSKALAKGSGRDETLPIWQRARPRSERVHDQRRAAEGRGRARDSRPARALLWSGRRGHRAGDALIAECRAARCFFDRDVEHAIARRTTTPRSRVTVTASRLRGPRAPDPRRRTDRQAGGLPARVCRASDGWSCRSRGRA
jgi:hypothetical protein